MYNHLAMRSRINGFEQRLNPLGVPTVQLNSLQARDRLPENGLH
jgi:hypothetical protein